MPINSFLYPGAKFTAPYEVANSCRFNNGSNDNLTRTQSSSNRRTFTFSTWLKVADPTISNAQIIMENYADSGNYFIFFINNNPNEFSFFDYSSSATQFHFNTTQEVRDPSAWYHTVVAIDTTQSTESNRVKFYVNGSQVTAFDTSDYPSQNLQTNVNNGNNHMLGRWGSQNGYGFDGYMAEVVFIDGQALDPTSFGEFDSDSPNIWKPIDVSGLTFGTNGYYLDFENASSLGADVSGNGNNFTVNNLTSVDQSTDTCTNNFTTMNPLNVPTSNAPTFLEGNLETEAATTGSERWMGSSTIGVSQGKWYAEVKIKTVDSCLVGITPNASENARNEKAPGNYSGKDGVGILVSSGNKYVDGNGTTHGGSTSADGIMMIALDLDNNNVYFGSGGQWADGSGSFNQSNPTSAISVTASSSTDDGAYFFAAADGGGSAKAKVQWNFGSPPYSISSGNADANGHGNFEYSVPSGYFALCSKNLAEFG